VCVVAPCITVTVARRTRTIDERSTDDDDDDDDVDDEDYARTCTALRV
jgi:hypothetical protein